MEVTTVGPRPLMNELLVVQLHLTLALRASRMECSVPVCQCRRVEPASLAAAARKAAPDGAGLHPPAKLGPLPSTYSAAARMKR